VRAFTSLLKANLFYIKAQREKRFRIFFLGAPGCLLLEKLIGVSLSISGAQNSLILGVKGRVFLVLGEEHTGCSHLLSLISRPSVKLCQRRRSKLMKSKTE
jgi:hypothetical protein